MSNSPQKSADRLIVEYLIVLADGGSFCDGVETFNRLLQVDSNISIKAGRISFSGDFSCDYRIAAGEVTGRGQRYFHVQFSASTNEGTADADVVVDKFSRLLKAVRTVVSKTGAQTETLWDGISYYLSQKAYTLFYDIENTMRKLIANFMLITIGKEWLSETSPAEVQDAISKSKRKDYVNVLHTVDFIHLADFLTKPYSKTPTQELCARIKAAKTLDDLQGLKSEVPMSNWQRYFASLLKCEDGYIQKRWSDLYDFRCKVAHNAIFTRQDYERSCTLVGELQPLLEEALRKLPQVTVPPEERETVAESAATTLSALVGDFITAWRLFEGRFFRKAEEFEPPTTSLSVALAVLQRAKVVEEPLLSQIRAVSHFRNHLVHSTGMTISEEDVRQNITLILRIIEAMQLFPKDSPQ